MKMPLIAALAMMACALPAHAQNAPPSTGTAASTAVAPAQRASIAQPSPKIVAEPVIQTIPVSANPKRPGLKRHSLARSSAIAWGVRAANRRALQEPVSHGFINAVQIYTWSEGALYRLLAAPGTVTDISLQPGESVSSVAAGDTVRWTVGDTSSGAGESKRAHILVKPFSAGLATNLIIATDRRTYHLEMASTPGTAMAAISWTYPEGDLIAIRHKDAEHEKVAAPSGAQEQAPQEAAGLSLDRLNFAYAISGDDPAWRPLRAFDDGRQTFIEFPAAIVVGEAPPLFILGAQGEAQLVNYRMNGHFYIVDRLFTAAELRLGTKKQAVVRITRADGATQTGNRRRSS